MIGQDFLAMVLLGVVGVAIAAGAGGAYFRDRTWYCYPWAVIFALLAAWELKVLGVLMTPTSPGESGGWQGLAKLLFSFALLPPLPALIVLSVLRPRTWRPGAPITGVALVISVLVAVHYFETRAVTFVLHDVTGKPLEGWAVEGSASNDFGNPSTFAAETNSQGEVRFRLPKTASVSLMIHLPIKNMPPPPEEWVWLDVGLSDRRDSQSTEISVRWKDYCASRYSVSFSCDESATVVFSERPGDLIIPITTRRMDQPMNLGYLRAWEKAFPSGRVEDSTLGNLTDLAAILHDLSSVRDFRDMERLDQVVRQLVALNQIVKALESLLVLSAQPGYREGSSREEITVQSTLLCEYLLGRAPDDLPAKIKALREFVDSRAAMILQFLAPAMKSNREAYNVLGDMRGLARPAAQSFAEIYPRASREVRDAMRRTFFLIGPAPEDILFALEELDDDAGKNFDAFLSAMRARSRDDAKRDWQVICEWSAAHHPPLPPGQLGKIADAIKERRRF